MSLQSLGMKSDEEEFPIQACLNPCGIEPSWDPPSSLESAPHSQLGDFWSVFNNCVSLQIPRVFPLNDN